MSDDRGAQPGSVPATLDDVLAALQDTLAALRRVIASRDATHPSPRPVVRALPEWERDLLAERFRVAITEADIGVGTLRVADLLPPAEDVLRAVAAGGRFTVVDGHGHCVAALVPHQVLDDLEAAEEAADLAAARDATAEGGELIAFQPPAHTTG